MVVPLAEVVVFEDIEQCVGVVVSRDRDTSDQGVEPGIEFKAQVGPIDKVTPIAVAASVAY